MHAPMACIFGLPAAISRLKNPARRGLNRTAVCVGRNSALRGRGLPAFDSRVFLRTPVPLVYSRGESPRYAAADWALDRRVRLPVHLGPVGHVAGHRDGRPPFGAIRATTSSGVPSLRAARTTDAPFSTGDSAVARPMPDYAPVTTTTWSRTFFSLVDTGFLRCGAITA